MADVVLLCEKEGRGLTWTKRSGDGLETVAVIE